jgi:hypothetical protein
MELQLNRKLSEQTHLSGYRRDLVEHSSWRSVGRQGSNAAYVYLKEPFGRYEYRGGVPRFILQHIKDTRSNEEFLATMNG